ncbi:MAG: hypothetical protein HND44_17985 [Chloroflexi bacterium]|nr:hypothetical protein [Ardenticatenaceae bacterium]MBL1130347.1 hypothetical protein [Chloroflexota bacterium]NOG36438.1 hypothetical protein [Chloroflexota bacterium]GIK57798.1 MAG: hypothetical protein BroJett015_34610 [Chloroflexota bacterium]
MLAMPETTMVDVADYQRRAEAFWQAEVTAQYQIQAGLPVETDLATVYEENADLFAAEVARELIELSRTCVNDNYRSLAAFATMRYLRQASLPYDEVFGEQLGTAVLPWDGDSLPFFATTGLLSIEADPTRRRLLYAGRSELVAGHNRLRQERWQQANAQAGFLGFASYHALCDELHGLHLENLELMAQTFLRETAVPYFRALSHWSQIILGTSQPDAADMFYLLRGSQFDGLFPAEKLRTAVYETTRRLGFSLENTTGLELDLDPREGKALRPFCAFVRVPDEIKLVVNPVGGHQDYKAVFHELGHALHGRHIPAHLPFATRYLGDDSVGEAFAFLFEQFPANPVWLREMLDAADYGPYVEYVRFMRLLFARRCAAKVLYENQLHMGLSDPACFYTAILQEHLGLNISPAYYLLDVDDGFYNAQYFRAWMLAAQIAAQLELQSGKEWLLSPATGAFLQSLWQKGQPAAETISVRIGERRLNPEALIRSFVA